MNVTAPLLGNFKNWLIDNILWKSGTVVKNEIEPDYQSPDKTESAERGQNLNMVRNWDPNFINKK